MTVCQFAQIRVFDATKTVAQAVLTAANLSWSFEAGGRGTVAFDLPTSVPQLVAQPDLFDNSTIVVAVPLEQGAAPTEIEMYVARGHHERDLVHRDGQAALRLTVSGAPHVTEAWLRDAVVRPEFGGVPMPQAASEERIFGWPSSAYDPDDDPAVWAGNLVESSRLVPYKWTEDGKTQYQTPKFPTGAGTAGAKWCTVTGGGGDRKLFRGWLTIATDDTVVRFYFSSDESATLWAAGEALLSTSDVEFGKRSVHTAERTFQAGTYALGIDTATHVSVGGDGVDPVLLAVSELDDDGNDVGWLFLSNDTTLQACRLEVTGTGSTPPGPTPGAILEALLGEAQTRATDASQDMSLLHVTTDFDATLDSDGDAWPDAEETVHRYGTPMWTVAEAMGDTGLDTKITPTKVLQGTYQGGQDLTTGDSPVWIRTFTSLRSKAIPAVGTVADTYTLDGWVTVTDSSVDTLGRRETFVELGTAPSLSQGERVLAAALSDGLGQQHDVLFGEFVAAEGAVPYLDFQVSDVVLVGPDHVPQRLLALGGSWGGNGPVVWHPVFGPP